MFIHNLKIAFRSLLKYKTQTLVSIFGLAIGFACVSLSVYWNHYEMTYDAFHQNADRIYRVRETSQFDGKVSPVTPGPLAAYLMENYPEVETACTMYYMYLSGSNMEGIPIPEETGGSFITPETLDMFDFQWVEGNEDMNTWNEKQIAIARHLATKMFGHTSPIGKKMTNIWKEEYEIVGIFEDWPRHSNFQFDIIGRLKPDNQWGASMYSTYAMLRPDADHPKFLQKAKNDTVRGNERYAPHIFDVWIPLKEMRYIHPEGARNVSLEDVRIFTMAALLIVVCALLNYLTLFISRLRAKGRTLALRTVYGSSGRQLVGLLMTEYMLLLLISWFFGMLFVEITMSAFMELAMVSVTRFHIYESCGYLILFAIALSALLSWVPIFYFKGRTLTEQIRPSIRGNRSHFRLASVCVQLMFSIGFIFCSAVMMKQIHFLTESDINIHRKKIGWLHTGLDPDHAMNLLKQLPCIDEAIHLNDPLFPPGWGSSHSSTDDWDGRSADDGTVPFRWMYVNDTIARFYGLKIKGGAASLELGKNEVFINETFARQMKMDHPVGKRFEGYTIKGVFEDFQPQRPTEKVEAMVFGNPHNMKQIIAIRYNGDYDNLMKSITETFANEEKRDFHYQDGERTYADYLKSENNLLKLLGITTVVSMLIALFGIYALIVQSCEQHRKQIAIRKVHGAQVSDILSMFFKQYMTQVLVASAIAFPVGYVLMKRWLEGYSRQTDISSWIFISIFVGVSALVTLCISWHVWKAANENPADVVKSE